MPRDPSHIFLSGSTGDFKQVRLDFDKALRRGGCKTTHQDDFPQTASDTLLKLAQLIEPCGLTVHMIGEKPGSIPTPEIRAQYLAIADREGKLLANHPALRAALGDFSTITYTQWEAYIAIHLGMPLFVYADSTYESPNHPQRAHIDRLKEMGRYATPFDDHSSLYRMVMADLMAHFRLNPATENIAAVLQPSNLPGGYIRQIFLGRDDFLDTLHQALQSGHNAAAITQKAAATGITGLGGIGKTHAAVAYADRHRGHYTALLFANADTPKNLHSSLAGLCGILYLEEKDKLPADEPSRLNAALRWLASHSGWLLIIDNVDDEPAAHALRSLLGQLTTGHLIITSRLHNWSSQVKNLDLSVLTPQASAELLIELTTHRLHVPAEDDAQALILADLLDGLPLAIHQAAGYINEGTRSFSDYIASYRQEAADLLGWLDTLAIHYQGPDKLPGIPDQLAPRPVLITWKKSFEKLSETDRAWLLVFSHFSPEPIPRFLLQPTEEATPEQKSMLRDADAAVIRAGKYSLLTLSTTEPVFQLHRLVQQITRLHAPEDERFGALETAIALIDFARPGDPHDVRSWPKWNPLQPHAVSLCEHSLDTRPPNQLTWLLSNLDCLYSCKGLHREAEGYCRRALAIDCAMYGGDHPNVAIDLSNLAKLLESTNRMAEAEPLLLEALRIDQSNYGDNHPNVARHLNALATLMHSANRLAEAEPLFRTALWINRAVYGDNHPEVARHLNSLAGLLQSANRLAEAEPLFREALSIDRAAYGDAHPAVARHFNNLAGLLHATNRLAEAEPLFRVALQIDRAAYGMDHPDVAIRLHNLARLLLDTCRYVEAEPLMRDALRIDQTIYGSDHPRVASDLSSLALLFYTTNRLAEAEPLMRDAVRIFHDSLGPEHPHTVTVSRNLEIILAEMAARE
ncbi:MAG: FxSxx-COOH system tetratricopeptide repeat protein [Luteolibacter sp.]|uniref:FxSxx-COOH system tetratricopeptide repeat protein n=1 Tax=Luteolibacter sp. TaxID=1962973 RepID=UPI003264AE6A